MKKRARIDVEHMFIDEMLRLDDDGGFVHNPAYYIFLAMRHWDNDDLIEQLQDLTGESVDFEIEEEE